MSGVDGLLGQCFFSLSDVTQEVWVENDRIPFHVSDSERLQLANYARQNNELDKARDLYSFLIQSDDLDIVGEAYYGIARIAESEDLPQQRLEYIERAANYGHVYAQYEYGLSLKDSDKEAAWTWLSVAANKGHIKAAKAAGEIVITNAAGATVSVKNKNNASEFAKELLQHAVDVFREKNAVGTEKERIAAVKEAFELGQTLLSVKSDTAEVEAALSLFKFAAENGHPLFHGHLGRSYEEHFRSESSCFQVFADKDEKKLEAHLAYVVGMFLKKSAVGKSIVLLEKAAEKGHLDAAFELSKIFSCQVKSREAQQAIWEFYKTHPGRLAELNKFVESEYAGAMQVHNRELSEEEKTKVRKHATNVALTTFCAQKTNILIGSAALAGHGPSILEKNCRDAWEKVSKKVYQEERCAEEQVKESDFTDAWKSLQSAMVGYGQAAEEVGMGSSDDFWLKQNQGKDTVYGTVGLGLIDESLENVEVNAESVSLDQDASQKLSEGVRYLELAVAAGYKGSVDHVSLYSRLGEMYEKGELVSKSYKRAIYYRNLALQLTDATDKKKEEESLKKVIENRTVISKLNGWWRPDQFSIKT